MDLSNPGHLALAFLIVLAPLVGGFVLYQYARPRLFGAWYVVTPHNVVIGPFFNKRRAEQYPNTVGGLVDGPAFRRGHKVEFRPGRFSKAAA